MPHDINSALVRLEENLEKVNSAREEVEKTVSSAKDLQEAISKYADSLNSYKEELGKFVQLVQNKAKDMDDTIQKFKDETKDTLKLFVDENKKLEKQVNSLNALQDSLKKGMDDIASIKSVLAAFVPKYDTSIADLSDKISAIKNSTDSLVKDTKNEYKPLWDTIESKQNTLIEKSDAIATSLTEMKKSCESIITSIDTKKKSIDETLASLQQSIDSSFTNITKKVNRNLWIMIAGFVAVIVAIILCK